MALKWCALPPMKSTSGSAQMKESPIRGNGGVLRRAGVLAAAFVVVVGALSSYAQTNASFTGITRNPTNTWTAAAAACAAPGSTTLNPAADTHVRQSFPTNTAGTGKAIFVGPGTNAADRGLLLFSLPALGANCALTVATLSLKVVSGPTGHTLQARNAASAWGETTVTWNTQPSWTATAATTATSNTQYSWISFNVLALIQAQYAGANNGYFIKDQTEAGATAANAFYSSEAAQGATYRPAPALTWS
jgi:hypothetical protein